MKRSYVFVLVLALMVVLAGCVPEATPVATVQGIGQELSSGRCQPRVKTIPILSQEHGRRI